MPRHGDWSYKSSRRMRSNSKQPRRGLERIFPSAKITTCPSSSKVEQFVIRRRCYHNSFSLFLFSVSLPQSAHHLPPSNLLPSHTNLLPALFHLIHDAPLWSSSRPPVRLPAPSSTFVLQLHLHFLFFFNLYLWTLTCSSTLKVPGGKTVSSQVSLKMPTCLVFHFFPKKHSPTPRLQTNRSLIETNLPRCSALAMHAYAVLFRAHRCFAPFQLFRRWE